jgi:hypothetical protein
MRSELPRDVLPRAQSAYSQHYQPPYRGSRYGGATPVAPSNPFEGYDFPTMNESHQYVTPDSRFLIDLRGYDKAMITGK